MHSFLLLSVFATSRCALWYLSQFRGLAPKIPSQNFQKEIRKTLLKIMTSLSKIHSFLAVIQDFFLITLKDLPIEFGEFGKDDPEEAVDEDVDKGLEAVGNVGIDGEISPKSWSLVSDCQSNCILAK